MEKRLGVHSGINLSFSVSKTPTIIFGMKALTTRKFGERFRFLYAKVQHRAQETRDLAALKEALHLARAL